MKTFASSYITRVSAAVVASLSPDLVQEQYRYLLEKSPLGGYCYVASEAMYYLLNGRESGYIPARLVHEGTLHYYLRHRKTGAVIDLTASQFDTAVPYDQGRGCCYRQSKPSKRAAVVIERAQRLLSEEA